MKKLLILFCLIIIQVQGQVDVTQDPRILNLLNQNKFNPKYRNQQQDASNPHYSSRITVRGREYGAYGKVRDFKQVNQNVVRVLNSTITGGGFVQEQVGIATAYRYTMPVTNKNHSRYLSQLARNYGKVSREKTITYKEGFESEIENSASTLVYKPNYKVVTKHVYNPNKKGSRGFVDTTMQLKGVVTRTVYTGTCPVGRGHIVNEEVAREDYNLHKAQTSYNELLMQNKIHEAKYLNQYYHKYNSSLRQARVDNLTLNTDYKIFAPYVLRLRANALIKNKDDQYVNKKGKKITDEWMKKVFGKDNGVKLADALVEFKNGLDELDGKLKTNKDVAKIIDSITGKTTNIDKVENHLSSFRKKVNAATKALKFAKANNSQRFGLVLDVISTSSRFSSLGLTSYLGYLSAGYQSALRGIDKIKCNLLGSGPDSNLDQFTKAVEKYGFDKVIKGDGFLIALKGLYESRIKPGFSSF